MLIIEMTTSNSTKVNPDILFMKVPLWYPYFPAYRKIILAVGALQRTALGW
jgi:hypothetical protein